MAFIEPRGVDTSMQWMVGRYTEELIWRDGRWGDWKQFTDRSRNSIERQPQLYRGRSNPTIVNITRVLGGIVAYAPWAIGG